MGECVFGLLTVLWPAVPQLTGRRQRPGSAGLLVVGAGQPQDRVEEGQHGSHLMASCAWGRQRTADIVNDFVKVVISQTESDKEQMMGQ